ncbi:MAG: hypothetical protein CSA58_05265 [Micrococcales bacterium]|nr:MAG: hypothetical protein CSA58_05265 [Micrococcales bacterium]
MPTPVTEALDAHRSSLSLHRRFVVVDDRRIVLDHVLSSRAGAFLIQERDTAQDVDSVRRTAEALELVVLRPIEPVLVVGADQLPGDLRNGTLRGVRVVPASGFQEWLQALPDVVDKGEMVMVNARLERATEDWGRRRRIPDWEVRARLTDNGIHSSAPTGSRALPPRPGRRDHRQPTAAAGWQRTGFLRGMSRTTKYVVALIAIAALITLVSL